MFKLNDVKTGANNATQEATGKVATPLRGGWGYVLDVCVIVVMGALLYWGASTQFWNPYNDVTRYQCYAVAFWHGTPALSALPAKQCAFLQATSSSTLAQKLQAHHFPGILVRLVESQSTSQPLHTLPPEYPFLTLIPFSLPLIAPLQWYQVTFAAWMALFAGAVYLLLKRYRSLPAALVFAFYLVLGNWATAEGRFDLVTGALTLGTVLLAVRGKWKWAFALLAFATLLKLYPAILLPPLLIAQQKQYQGEETSCRGSIYRSRRWSGLGVFIAICVIVTAVSLALNVADTVSPFRYFFDRPVQIESFPATLVWLGSFFGYPVQYPFTFESQNIVSALSSTIGLLSTICLVVGVLYTFWLQWRDKIDLPTTCLLTLLVMIAFGKVFSPQYLIWVTPLVAYVGKSNWKWLVSWGAVALLTTLIYPFSYNDLQQILHNYYLVIARDFLLVAIVLALLIWASRAKPATG